MLVYFICMCTYFTIALFTGPITIHMYGLQRTWRPKTYQIQLNWRHVKGSVGHGSALTSCCLRKLKVPLRPQQKMSVTRDSKVIYICFTEPMQYLPRH